MAATLGLVVLAPAATAAITMQGGCPAGATAMGNAITDQPGLFVGATWVHNAGGTTCSGTYPTGTANAAISTTFGPPVGTNFAIMTTGDVNYADDPNSSGSTGWPYSDTFGGANDVSVLRVDVNVPSTDNCLLVDVQFLSEEFPEFVGGSYNDAFLVELDANTWTIGAGSSVSAPDNFAFDSAGNPLTINSVGAASMTAGNAAGSTYDGGTPKLAAETPITPGAHTIYFSIFDLGDHSWDSAAFIDNMRTINSSTTCDVGVVTPPPPPPPIPPVAVIGVLGVGLTCQDSVVHLSGSASSDADGLIVSYAWNFGDGTTATGAFANHVYATPGPHTVTLTVTDNTGLTNTVTRVVPDIGDPNCCPALDAMGDIYITEGDTISFFVTATDFEGDALTFGSTPLLAGTTWDPSAAHFFWKTHVGNEGDYTVNFSVWQGSQGSPLYCQDLKTIHIIIKAKPHATQPDTDLDGLADTSDNCPGTPNHDQSDVDHDGIGDACDANPTTPDENMPPPAPLPPGVPDQDRDGIADAADNCPSIANTGQADTDQDHVGDVCDRDLDGDGVANIATAGAFIDNCPTLANADQADSDGDGVGDACQEGFVPGHAPGKTVPAQQAPLVGANHATTPSLAWLAASAAIALLVIFGVLALVLPRRKA